MGACLTKILVQRIRRGRFRVAGEIAKHRAILTSKRAEICGPIRPPKDRVFRQVPRQACITSHEALQADGLGKGKRTAEGCSEIDHLIATGFGLRLAGLTPGPSKGAA